jgi:serine/threonine protein kinase
MDTIKDYTIKSELGQGGMATVYLAEHKTLGLPVAVKILAKEFAHNENIRKRFLAEARNMFKMGHPNIIKVTDLIEEGDTVAFVMEYIEGETLKDYLERKGKLNNDEIKTIFTQILAAVAYVHEQGLIHRDIKPSNFMISPNGQVKLLDFGIAKNTDTNSAEYTQTSTSQQMGTPMYMSPEQVNETKSVTAQSDIYSLGVVLWQMVMGQKPYDTKTLSNFQLQSKIVNENLALTNTNWDTSIQKATHKNLDNRYTSAQQFLNDLQNLGSIKDDKTIFENKDESTVIENTKAHPDKLIPECSVCKKKYTNGDKFCPLDGGAIKLDDDILKMKVNDTQKENKDSKIQENISTPQQPITNGPKKYNKAPNGKRFLAYLLDTMIIIGLCLPSLYLMTLYFYSFYYYYVDYGYIQEIPKKFILGLVLLIIPIGYALMKDGIGEGQSYGKRALDLMVINLNTYEQCTKLNSVGRNLLFGIICGIPCVGTLLEIIMVFANPEGRKLSDLIAGTQVIEKSTYINNLNY